MSASPRLSAVPFAATLTALALGLAACASKPAQPETSAAAAPDTAATQACDAGKAQALIGQPATDQAVAKAMRDSGAATVRVIKPGQPVTLDYRHDRLNIEVDADNLATGVKCG